VVNDVPENREVAGDAALYFDARAPRTLTEVLERLEADPGLVASLRARAGDRARTTYAWDRITDQYEALFRRLRGVGVGVGA
jgi:glycosyltransferase involved in cell wall biosynthesis